MKTLGLIGKSLNHSFSKGYFEAKFSKELLTSHQYINIEIEDIAVINLVIKEHDLSGFNVTIPYKEEIIPFCQTLSKEAAAIGAVNTVIVQRDANGEISLHGHNTDAFGFGQSIKPFLEGSHEKALILGTGGASKSVAFVLENLGIEVFYASRTISDANHFLYSHINEHVINHFPLIVNTTPVGTYPNVTDFIDLPFDSFSPNHLVIDLIYNPSKTVLLQKAKAQGAKTLNGLSMLHQQAEKAWELFSKE